MSADDFYRRISGLHRFAEQARRMEELTRPYRACAESIARTQREIEQVHGALRSATERLSLFHRGADAALEAYRLSLSPSLSQFSTVSEMARQLVEQHRAVMQPYERIIRSTAILPEVGSIVRELNERNGMLAEVAGIGRPWCQPLDLLGTTRVAMDMGRAIRDAIEQQARLASLPDIVMTVQNLRSTWEALTRSPAGNALEAIYGRGLIEHATVAAAAHLSGSVRPEMDELRRASFLFNAVAILEEAEDFWNKTEAEESSLGAILRAILSSVLDHLERAKTQLERESILAVLSFVLALVTFVSDRLDSAGQETAIRSLERGFAEVGASLDSLADTIEHQINPAVSGAVRSLERGFGEVESELDRLADAVERQNDLNVNNGNHHRLVVVLRNANIRELPSTKVKVIDKVYPNQLAELVDVRGDWFFVRYYDYLSGLAKSGWIYSRLVKPAYQRGEPELN